MPTIDMFTQYQEGLSKGLLLGISCRLCGVCTLPFQAACYKCGSRALEIKELKRRGIVKTFTVIHIVPKGFTAPLIVAMVLTKDNVCVMGNILNFNSSKINNGLIGREVQIDFRMKESPTDLHKQILSLVFTLI